MNSEKIGGYYNAGDLYSEVMGIALGVMGTAGKKGPLFAFIDQALDNFNVSELNLIREVFSSLPNSMQRDIVSDTAPPNRAGIAVQRFERATMDRRGKTMPRSA